MLPRIVFMGSPDFAVPSLQTLSEHFDVVGVVTQPDRPAGRGRVLTPPPIKLLADQLGLPVIQPKRLREPPAMQQLQDWAPDVIIVVAFGQILRQDVLDLPEHGCVNVHASLLPRWRGAAPIQAAILNNDLETGVTIMKMDQGVDTGPILSQQSEPINNNDDAGTLSQRLAILGAELLNETLPKYLASKLTIHPQDDQFATYAPLLKKEDGELDFHQSAEYLARQVRAYNPWPGTYTFWKNEILKIHQVSIIEGNESPPGSKGIIDGFPAIAVVDSWLILLEVQPAGKKSMSGKTFLQGARNWVLKIDEH
jgi:methionyl-tRNA formyltransferase